MLYVIKRTLIDKTFLVTLILAIIALVVGHVKTTDVNFQTIYSLDALLITVSIYQELGILKHIAHYIVSKCSSSRKVFLVLMLCAFIGSMLLTNDVAILTLVPIFFNIKKYMHLPSMTTISLLTIFANLGSSVTPFGNPQNIYLYGYLLQAQCFSISKYVSPDWRCRSGYIIDQHFFYTF